MSETTRREFLKDAALTGAAITTGSLGEGNLLAAASQARGAAPASAASQPVTLSWLGGEAPLISTGVSWGVPWPRGAVQRGAPFNLAAQGKQLPVQTWPLADWPDGSLKWSGFATVVPEALTGPVTLATGASTASGALKVANAAGLVRIDTGAMQCSIPAAGGANLVEAIVDRRAHGCGPGAADLHSADWPRWQPRRGALARKIRRPGEEGDGGADRAGACRGEV